MNITIYAKRLVVFALVAMTGVTIIPIQHPRPILLNDIALNINSSTNTTITGFAFIKVIQHTVT